MVAENFAQFTEWPHTDIEQLAWKVTQTCATTQNPHPFLSISIYCLLFTRYFVC